MSCLMMLQSFALSKPEEGRHTAQSANQLTSLVIDLSGVRVPEEDTLASQRFI